MGLLWVGPTPTQTGQLVTKGVMDTAIAGAGGGSSPTLANIPAGSVITVYKAAGVWPSRPTSRTDITVMFVGADPSPAIVTSPALTGMYNGDLRVVTAT